MIRIQELEVLITTAQAERAEFVEAGRPPGMSQKDFDGTVAGWDNQISNYTRQRQEILNAERKAKRARKEAEEIAERQRKEVAERAERERRKAEEQAKLDAEKARREKEAADKARAERLAAEAKAREDERVAQLRKEHAQKEAAEKEKQRAQERAAMLGAVLTGPNGEEATKFRLKVPGGHVVVQFVPEVTE